MARLTRLLPGTLDEQQQALRDAIVGGPRASGPFAVVDEDGGLNGPFNAMLLAPQVGTALQALGTQLRFEGTLTERAREMVILLVAHHWESVFEIYAHSAVGASIGLLPDELSALREGSFDVFTDPIERQVMIVTSALLADSDLDDLQYAQTVDAIGASGVFEVSTLVGYYSTLALQLRVFRVEVPTNDL